MGKKQQKIGAVLVMGGGVAGMQAALDCANSGFKVYLLEKEPAIGGNMARLDKTFPTNDCAMCMISPKLVETARHLNIEIISYADLQKVEGEAGNFTVTVRKRSRFVDEKKCNGCGDCERVCPVSIPDTFNGGLASRKAIYRMYPQAIPNVFTIDKQNDPPPCRGTCPAGVNAQGYVALTAKGEFLKALSVVRDRMPFAGICGRVCHHPCESACNRAQIDAPVGVRNIKRFLADYEREKLARGESVALPPSEIPPVTPVASGERVAIVGGGPAGLTCAGDLSRMGYEVTVFEAQAQLGGMMRMGIPAYRLPREILDHEIEQIVKGNVRVKTGQALGRDFTLDGLRADGFRAVFVATGAPLARKIPLAGLETKGVVYGLDFLKEVNLGGSPQIGRETVVIGGGNVAMDVARSALRLTGGKVKIYCLESRDQMPASSWEIEEAIEEGIEIHPSWGPSKVVEKNGVVAGIEFVRCMRVFDEQKRFNPAYDQDQKNSVAAETIILAVGQACDVQALQDSIKVERGLVHADPLTLSASQPGIFAGGDNVLGPASLVQAVAQGHRAAESIHRYIAGKDLRENREPAERSSTFADTPTWADTTPKARQPMPAAAPAKRRTSFSEIDQGWTAEMAVAEAQRCLACGHCSVCRECVATCKARAIDHNLTNNEIKLSVGGIVMTAGYDHFDPRRKPEFGYGRYPNVVTNMQFERILSASGPYDGHVKRPSDGKTPKRVAWIQCVGSRDATLGNHFCSSVCCMAATKEAMVAKEHQPGLDATIFYMDMRAFEKDFDRYYERAKNEAGVKYVKCIPSRIVQKPRTADLTIRFVNEQGRREEQDFDMVVLSTGMQAGAAAKDSAARLGVALNEHGFCAARRLDPVATSRPGVFVAGAFGEPKDIPESVVQASAAASKVMELLAGARNTLARKKDYPAARDVSNESPRVGVFVCHCGLNIASVVDVPRVVEAIAKMPNVAVAQNTLYTCSESSLTNIREQIKLHRLNRIVVASCTPRTHEPLFREAMREAGLNPYLFDLANIRDQCSWVHQSQPEAATLKAIELVRMSVARASRLAALENEQLPVTQSALVIGGGLSGMTAALSIADQGFKVHLVEREERLGGNLLDLLSTLERDNIPEFAAGLIDRVEKHPQIKVYTRSEVSTVAGHIGKFHSVLARHANSHASGNGKNGTGKNIEIDHGVVIVATGARAAQTTDYLNGASDRVVTQTQLEKLLTENTISANGSNTVMIQCVGSRDEQHPYCSRICCSMAVKNAIALKEKDPKSRVFVLYRDVRTYGYRETYYKKARELGVVFIRYDETKPPAVTEGRDGLVVALESPDIPEPIRIEADRVVLSTGMCAPEGAVTVADMLKVPLNADGFFLEAHMKLRPVDFATEGIFLCGLAHSPKFIDENISQAKAAAARAAVVLSKTYLEVGGVVSRVDQSHCISCMTCVHVCPYGAPSLNADGKSTIEGAKCMGCGICTAECPAHAIHLNHFDAEHFEGMLEELLAAK